MGGIVQVSYEDVGLPTPLELEERKAQAIKDSSGYLEELALENDRLMRENKALKYLTDNLKDFLMKIDPQTAKLIEDLPPKP